MATDEAAPQRIYAIGDIHGRLDLLRRAIGAIRRDIQEHGAAALTITIGDYVDRGPHSRGVIERLIDNPFPTPYVALKGNHEDMLEAFLADAAAGPQWCCNGGEETLQSYGVRLRGDAPADFELARQAFRAALPGTHLRFLRALEISHGRGRYFFCHAGVRPGVPLARQRKEDMLWIREPFLASEQDFGAIVVHGHTPAAAPELRRNRIGIDTGAFYSGRLTCVALEEGEPRFLPV